MESSSEQTHLWSLIKERVPYFKEDVADDAIHKHHQEPVECDEGVVDFVLFKVGMQSRQLLAHEVSEHTLVHLEREQRGEVCGGCHGTERVIQGPGGLQAHHSAPRCSCSKCVEGSPQRGGLCAPEAVDLTQQALTEYPLTVILSTGRGAGCDGLRPRLHSKCPMKTAAAELVE